MKVKILTDAWGNEGSIGVLKGIDGGDIQCPDENGAVILHYTLLCDGALMTAVYRDEFEIIPELSKKGV